MDATALFADLERKYGLPAGFLARTYQLESSGGKNLYNPQSGAAGPFQFMPRTAEQYGLKNPMDLEQSADAAARLARDNAAYLQKQGIESPSAAQLYLAHQQGAKGAANLLQGGGTAGEAVGAKAVAWNGGSPGMPATDFADKWISKFNGATPPRNQIASTDGGLFGRLFSPQTKFDAPPSPVSLPTPQTGVAMPQNIAMSTAPGLAPTAGGAPSFAAPMNNQAALDASRATPFANPGNFNFAGLGASGLAMMAAGAPQPTWQPGPAAPAHRGDANVNLMGILAPAKQADEEKKRMLMMGLLG